MIAVPVAWVSGFSLAIVADYRLFPVTILAVPGYGVLLIAEKFGRFRFNNR